ncbi:MAG: glycosyltransferase [Formosa sp.]|nr:glycosyltransferase [Formosa sp.]
MLSILIPTLNFNVEKLVEELYNQASSCNIDFEIIIGDDFSSKIVYNSSELIKTDLIQLFRVETSVGRTEMRKQLSLKAKYSWILYIDADMFPNEKKYLPNYLIEMQKNPDKKIFFGGYSYSKQYSGKGRLRFRYGIKREFKSALKREIKPYRNIYSGNMLIHRETFELINIPLENVYGLDLAFSGQLEFHKIPFKHIDNYTCHRDIDDNNTFLLKSKEASITIRNLYDQGLINPKQSKLIWAYILIKKLHLIKIVKLKGRLLSPLIYWMLNNFRAPLITLDFYKLYHFCKK